jgi:hypothetical protein
MAKQGKQALSDVLNKRNPLERQVVTPVDVLEISETERSNRSDEPNARTDITNETTERINQTREKAKRTGKPTGQTEQGNRPIKPNERTQQTNATTERKQRTVFDDLQAGTEEESRRGTERYSFEIYSDQKGSIEEVQYLYKKKTGKKLSASRIIREALEAYLHQALEALRE